MQSIVGGLVRELYLDLFYPVGDIKAKLISARVLEKQGIDHPHAMFIISQITGARNGNV
jgi:hypothetical protein